MRTTSSSFTGLVLAAVVFGTGCNVWVNGDPIGDWPGKAGNAGSSAGGSGPGGQAGAGGTDNGEGGYAGSPGGAGKAGYAGTGGFGQGGEAGQAGTGGFGQGGEAGQAGTGGGNGGIVFPAEFELVGGDIDEDREIFPFGVAVAADGTLFVSTLGNRDNEPSRIYRFAPGTTSAPEVLFQVGKIDDAAIYGLTFDNQGQLYACLSQHLLSTNNNVVASILRFDPAQLGDVALGPNNVFTTSLRSTAVNDVGGGGFVVGDAVEAGRCGQLAFDGNSAIYAPDASGDSGFLFRYNVSGDLQAPGGAPGDLVNESDLSRLVVTAWLSDPAFGPGVNFGVTGVAVSQNTVNFVREDDDGSLFSLGINGLRPESFPEIISISPSLASPLGLAALGGGG
ncbi:MAG: hypothetical protein MUF34_29075, partial [Polyangiaceae bacterium]|nr:hypothetical protein [Polyangiaceae bacterium]